jgi:Fur family transcriptional regulator, ferric uptake regulator
MTIASEIRATPAADVPAAIAALRASGLRVSAARRVVLQALFAAGRPATVEELAAGLDGRLPASDLASMYRNLETLESVGLVRHLHFGHGAGRYVLRGAGDPAYVACHRCGAFEELDETAAGALRAVVQEHTAFGARFTHFPVVGLCPDCRGLEA